MAAPRIFQINASDGGVPKRAVHGADVTREGLAGDRQNDLKNHGGPDRALCLYSLERILDLQAEGHPIFPGAAGENVTLAGVDWDTVVPGAVLRLGDEVVIEIVKYTAPCGKIGACFADRNHRRIAHEERPGWARVYARVLEAGAIGVGDRVAIR